MSRDDWNRYAAFYGMYLYSSRHLYDLLAERIAQDVKGRKVLDAACGNGALTERFASAAENCIAADYADRMLAKAVKEHSANGRITYMEQDVCALPFPDRYFDAVVMANALDQIVQPESALKEASRVLKDDGILIVPTYVGGERKRGGFYRNAELFSRTIVYHNWTPETFLDFLEEQDWKIKEQQVLASDVPFMYAVCHRKTVAKAEDNVINTSGEELYLPLMARIYASRHFPHLLFDRAALNIEDRLPEIARSMPEVSEFTYLCHAVLSANAERLMRKYLTICPDAIAVNVRAGLETLSLRCASDKTVFYELDEQQNLSLRESFFPGSWYDRFLPYHMLDERWVEEIRKEEKRPLLINACGAFADHTQDEVSRFLSIVSTYGDAFVIFDADTSGNGGILVQQGNLKEQTNPTFTMDRIQDFAQAQSFGCEVLENLPFFEGVERGGMSMDTKLRIAFIHRLGLRRMYVLKIHGTEQKD